MRFIRTAKTVKRSAYADEMYDFIKSNQKEFDLMMNSYVNLVNKIPKKYHGDCEQIQNDFVAFVLFEHLNVINAPKKEKQRIIATVVTHADLTSVP